LAKLAVVDQVFLMVVRIATDQTAIDILMLGAEDCRALAALDEVLHLDRDFLGFAELLVRLGDVLVFVDHQVDH